MLALLASATAWSEEVVVHHGFSIHLMRGVSAQAGTGEVLRAVERQVEMVEQVGLAPEVMAFFRRVPVYLYPESGGTPGLYSKKNQRVGLKLPQLAADQPILLHEFLHAYHDQILLDGYENPDVLHFYELGLQTYRMSRSEYFLSNEREFFAITASIYLHGSIQRAPFDRRRIQTMQPLYWKFLEGLFGKREA